ncbi:MAG: dihydropteroate synthase [Prevotellaceae bacterium]|jgi:dihydropteroate synthase|nr:dihydropteroate synthase [Prevotellaceae bacterium]
MQIFRKRQTINCGGKLLDLSKPAVMGILNVTPDSFYAASRITGEHEIMKRVETVINEGAAIVDIGAYSSRPDAVHISCDEEYRRLQPAVYLIKKHFPDIFISIDTFRADIVHILYEKYGHFIVNDISAGEMDKNMIPSVAKFGLPYIAMHMRGAPDTMQNPANCYYEDIVNDIITYFVDKKRELVEAGVTDIIFDPGFGFSKTLEANYKLLAGLDAFKVLGQPVLAGISRKSMFYRLLGCSPEQSLAATVAGNMAALQNGADILRVHDVKAAYDTVAVFNELNKFQKWTL